MTAAVNELEDGDDDDEEEAAAAPAEQKRWLGIVRFCNSIHLSRCSRVILLVKPDSPKCPKSKTINPGDL